MSDIWRRACCLTALRPRELSSRKTCGVVLNFHAKADVRSLFGHSVSVKLCGLVVRSETIKPGRLKRAAQRTTGFSVFAIVLKPCAHEESI